MAGAPPPRFGEELMYLLHPAGNDGQLLGCFAGQPIFESVHDPAGRHYVYVGAAPRLRNGRVNVAALGENQWLVEPGLVYELCAPTQHAGRMDAPAAPASANPA
jgi:hypothetical protein